MAGREQQGEGRDHGGSSAPHGREAKAGANSGKEKTEANAGTRARSTKAVELLPLVGRDTGGGANAHLTDGDRTKLRD